MHHCIIKSRLFVRIQNKPTKGVCYFGQQQKTSNIRKQSLTAHSHHLSAFQSDLNKKVTSSKQLFFTNPPDWFSDYYFQLKILRSVFVIILLQSIYRILGHYIPYTKIFYLSFCVFSILFHLFFLQFFASLIHFFLV